MKTLQQIFDRLEESNINIYEYKEGKNICGYELNTYTDAGVNQILFIDFRDTGLNPKKANDFLKLWNDRIESIDIDEELRIHLEDKRYRNEIGAVIGAQDFKDWKLNLQSIFSTKKESRQRQFEQVKDKLYSQIQEIESILELIPKKGDTSIDCQRTGIQQKINEIDSLVNGLTIKDFKPNEYSTDFKLSYS